MTPLNTMGKFCIVVGALLIVVGAVLVLGGKVPWVGRLPGDIYIERRNFTFAFPLATSILISVVVSLLWFLLSKR